MRKLFKNQSAKKSAALLMLCAKLKSAPMLCRSLAYVFLEFLVPLPIALERKSVRSQYH